MSEQKHKMRIDISEVKTFKTCGRKWYLSSRNMCNLKKKNRQAYFAVGTTFHEALHRLYSKVSLEKVQKYISRHLEGKECELVTAMVTNYAQEVLPQDLERFEVLEIEHYFSYEWQDYDLCGSIDMVVLDKQEGKVYGFEHKTCAKFRDELYLKMDEQPRLYAYVLQDYTTTYNMTHGTHYEYGGIYLNEVRKLKRKFEHCRRLLNYSGDECDAFMAELRMITDAISTPKYKDIAATPNYFNCQMCDYKDVCMKYAYHTMAIEAQEVLKDFPDDFEVPEVDHLDEKREEVRD